MSSGVPAGAPDRILMPAKNVACGMYWDAMIEGGGIAPNGLANWNDAGVVVLEIG